ncbi:hypothetical protein C8J56DRAFT_921500 [Mycena floridula]|nr:hypothetical protein C8J56DRAFT_921500 [Mycena floridula]
MVLPSTVDVRLERSRIGRVGRDVLCGNRISVHVERRRERMEQRNKGPLGSRRLGQNATTGSRSARERPGDDRDFSFLHSATESPELVVGDSYRIHIAEYRGKVTAVKVYEGPDAKEKIEADIALNNRIRHHAIVKYIDSCTTASPPFAVFDSVVLSSGTSADLNSLPCYLAGALRRSEKESLVVGARLMRDVASGLDHISKFFPLAGIALDLFVKKDKIYISLGADELGQAQNDDHPVAFYHALCREAFHEANRECHFDKRKVVNNSENSETESNSDPDFESDNDSHSGSASESPLGHTEVVEDESEPSLPRREYAFVPVDNLSLRDIVADYSRFIHQLEVPMSGAQYLHYLQRNARRATPVRHRCSGYIRQEVTLSTSVSDSAIISHRTPSLQEICQLCGRLAEAGYFRCSCGHADDGIAPTVQCCRCLKWAHRRCQSSTMCQSCSGTLNSDILAAKNVIPASDNLVLVGEGEEDRHETLYCFCQKDSYGEMIGCDDRNCERQWFHLACIGLTIPPADRYWFCEPCKNKRNAKPLGRGGKRRTITTKVDTIQTLPTSRGEVHRPQKLSKRALEAESASLPPAEPEPSKADAGIDDKISFHLFNTGWILPPNKKRRGRLAVHPEPALVVKRKPKP